MQCYIGLGSNLNNPREQVSMAIEEIKQLTDTIFIKASSLYQTKPVGPQSQPDFINAVVCIETNLTAHNLLTALQSIENAHGRVRTNERNGPRTLDLDLLLYGEETINTESLTVPHPRMHERKFVQKPLAEIQNRRP